ncbi:hypothetical protein CN100_01095 [Sinorhizobium meliloti]|uniref:phage fiber-tail adaptor protein n=1 Tax=Rhizobium meliloti TaxID=382 RepID=UPI0003177F57|nr:hypothetical protein [Sinorhizobium meliloti]ATB03608.1 hypothetical protein BWO90_16435 [Sinorhizobium meliloti]KKA13706.1 hypothetical protein VP03_12250 [Sinorhizobium meliloti]MDE3872994.1 hypothetical protein [Sinorhizobium meliloti]RVN60309.1 hypothetical protein CN104_23325 [Sinorhizobium meliloti]RVO27562.1 hypothetical protein CN100_01095 [Sinorhizobium meliloti]
MALTWPAIKDPNEVKDYSLDWSALLGASDTITSSTWSIDEGEGLMIDSDSHNGTETTIWLSAGSDGTNCSLVNRVVTAGGRTYDQTVRLKVRAK